MANEYHDYFSPMDARSTYTFPDGKSSITFRKLLEKDRAYLQNLRSDIELDQTTKRMLMKAASGTLKMETIERAAIEWDIMRKKGDGQLERVPFTSGNLKGLLENLEPDIVDAMYDLIVKNNKWLNKNESKEELKEQRKELDEKIAELESEEKK